MNKSLVQLGQQLSAIWKELGFNQRVSIVVAGLAVIAGLAGIATWSNRVEYSVLFGNLGDAEAGKVIAALDEAKVDYRVRNGSILVPADQVHRLRMQLVSKGIPGGGKTGFSLFDKPNFGISDFVQRVNYTRAIQGELGSTIGQVDGIEHAEVLLVMPENRLLVEYQKKPSASVFIKLRGNTPVSGGTVNAIRFLVANAVEGLVPAAVSVTDNLGNLLTDQLDSDPIAGASTSQLKHKKEYESYLAKQAETFLMPIAGGAGRVLARVAVDLDFTTMQRDETKFDPEGQVLRKARVTDEKLDNTTGNQAAGGVPGTPTNASTDTNSVAGTAGSQTTRNNTAKKTTENEYEINKTVTSQSQAPGRVKRISAAVFIPLAFSTAGTNRIAAPRSPEDLLKLRRGVQAALGIQEKGGVDGRVDELTVEEIAFNDEPAREMAVQIEKTERQRFWMEMARNAVFPAIGLVVLVAFWRAFQKTSVDDIPIGVPLGHANGNGHGNGNGNGHGNGNGNGGDSEEVQPFVMTTEMLTQLVRENPANMTHALRTWMTRGGEKAK
jgi:flagellar M-ring protein FliF